MNVSHIWKADKNNVALKLRLRRPDQNNREEDWESEDWTGRDESFVYLFDSKVFTKLQIRMEAFPSNTEQPSIVRWGLYLRKGNLFVYNGINWEEINECAISLMNTFPGTHELYLKSDAVLGFATIFQKRREKAHCDILELSFKNFKMDQLDWMLSHFESVQMLILSNCNDRMINHHVLNYQQISINCSTFTLTDLFHLKNEIIELINPLKLNDSDVADFVNSWIESTSVVLEKIRFEFINMDRTLNINRIGESLNCMPYNQQRRDNLKPNLCKSKTHHFDFLFGVTIAVDVQRPDGLTASLVEYKNSIYFVVWHCN